VTDDRGRLVQRWTQILADEERRRSFFCRVFAIVIGGILPATALLLLLLPHIDSLSPYPDLAGLIAVSVGITGILIFFIFLYKYQATARLSMRRRLALLGVHAASATLLFVVVIWLGFASPWSRADVWGDWNLQTASRSWVIAVIVVGTISALGSLFHLMRLRPPRHD
jgi:hypothetical protein